MDTLDWFMQWYASQCDGEWEHRFGPSISTIDNPGWSLEVELKGTNCDGRVLDRVKHNYDHPTDWWTCWTEGNTFHGAGGPFQLRAILESFRGWVEKNRIGSEADNSPPEHGA